MKQNAVWFVLALLVGIFALSLACMSGDETEDDLIQDEEWDDDDEYSWGSEESSWEEESDDPEVALTDLTDECINEFNEHGLEVNCSMRGFDFSPGELTAILQGPTDDQDQHDTKGCPTRDYESWIGSYNGIGSYSNGEPYCWTWTGNGHYQCVEYVNRYFGISGWGNGRDHFQYAQSHGIPAHPQGSSAKPQPGDMLCWDGGSYGHVAVIKEVGGNYVKVIEQNWHNSPNYYRELAMWQEGSGWKVASGSGTLWIEGWVRPNGGPSYSMDYAYQVPDGELHLHTSEIFKNVVIAYENTGTATWYKNDLTLVSCDSSGHVVSSLLYDPGSWISDTKVTKMDQSVVTPGNIARFTFNIKLPHQPRGWLTPVYFRVQHRAAGLLEDWREVNLPVFVWPTIEYNGHIENIGWQGWRINGQTSGTTGRHLQMEALSIRVPTYSVRYRVHMEGIGWGPWRYNGYTAGTTGQHRQIEAVQIVVPDYDVWANCHVENIGWIGWKKSPSWCGTTGHHLQLEAIQIIILPHRPG